VSHLIRVSFSISLMKLQSYRQTRQTKRTWDWECTQTRPLGGQEREHRQEHEEEVQRQRKYVNDNSCDRDWKRQEWELETGKHERDMAHIRGWFEWPKESRSSLFLLLSFTSRPEKCMKYPDSFFPLKLLASAISHKFLSRELKKQ